MADNNVPDEQQRKRLGKDFADLYGAIIDEMTKHGSETDIRETLSDASVRVKILIDNKAVEDIERAVADVAGKAHELKTSVEGIESKVTELKEISDRLQRIANRIGKVAEIAAELT